MSQPEGMIRSAITVVTTLVALSLLGRADPPARPLPEARETEWSAYLADREGWIDGDLPEHWLLDGTRVDVIGPDTVWEVEWLHNGKWKESFGQAQYYRAMTGKKAGVWFLMRGQKDEANLLRAIVTWKQYELDGKHYEFRVEDVTK